jgi:oxygen-independent coproporphyrinogen III oxidase
VRDGGPGAYVHVPFCAHRCTYCSFTALEGLNGEAAYFEAVLEEIKARRGEIEAPLDTIYFGGGTPSYVDTRRLRAVLDALEESFGIAADAEVTAEGNPDDLDDERLGALQALGVNRLSIGVQSLADAELVPLERRHDAGAARSAVSRAVERFGNVSADLMIGIPGQTRESLRSSVDGLLGTGIRHLSVYLLEIEKAPRLVALRREQPPLFADDDEMATRWEDVDARASASGLPRYEVSNWARRGFESRHNSKYWSGSPVLGFGVAAHSFDGRLRRANSGAMLEYARLVRENGSAFVSEVTLPPDAAQRERVLLGLRLSAGVPEGAYEAARASLAPTDRERLDDREAAGLLTRSDGRVSLTREGTLLSNEIFSLLL